MALTPLGPGRIQVSRVVLGCMWSAQLREHEIERLVHAACDHGISSFDTAPLYAFHASEEMLGRALRDRRSSVQILTKAGLRWDSDHGRVLFAFTDGSGQRRQVRKDSRPASLRAEVEASLRRLQVEQIDLIQIHHPDVDTPIADALGELSRLRDEGKVRALGVSNYARDQLCEATDALGEWGLDALQCEYNLVERWAEREVLPVCMQRGVGVLAYSPLAKGVLAGAFRLRDARLTAASRGSSYGRLAARALTQGVVEAVNRAIARNHSASVDQVALAWLLHQPAVSAVVCGASTESQIAANARAQHLRLSEADIARMGGAFASLPPVLHAIARLSSR